MISAFGVEHSNISKGWGAGTAQRSATAATKARLKSTRVLRENDPMRGLVRSGEVSARDAKRWAAEDDFAARSSRKARNFVDRFAVKDGKRVAARPGVKTSMPRQRSLTPNDKEYISHGQGVYGSGKANYELTGNKRVRKSAFGV